MVDKKEIAETIYNIQKPLQKLAMQISVDLEYFVSYLRKIRKILSELEDTQEYINQIDESISYFENIDKNELIRDLTYSRVVVYKMTKTIELINKITKNVFGFVIDELRDIVDKMEVVK